jgi:hypothetical protein
MAGPADTSRTATAARHAEENTRTLDFDIFSLDSTRRRRVPVV